MIAETPWDTKFSIWLSWVAPSSLASTITTLAPSSSARAWMPSCTRLRNVSLLGNATPIVTLLSVTGSGGVKVGAADAGASDPGAIDMAGDMGAGDSDGLWAVVKLETPRNIPATTARVVNRQA